jgi:sulfate transport system substrate-binding protein
VAEAYLQFLYSKEGQEIEAKNHYRPRDEQIVAAHPEFKKLPMYTVADVFGGWQKAQKTHFADGGVFDQIYKPGGK